MSIDVSRLSIVHYPAPVLRQKTKPIDKITPEVRAVVEKMNELMRTVDGIGLAAPQIGLAWRLFIVDVPAPSAERRRKSPPPSDYPEATNGLEVYINPVLSHPQGNPELCEEGCLSIPDIRGDVLRPPIITVTATDLDGKSFTKTTSGLLARCLQHEFDHLEGVLMLDRFTQMSRLKARPAVKDLEGRLSSR